MLRTLTFLIALLALPALSLASSGVFEPKTAQEIDCSGDKGDDGDGDLFPSLTYEVACSGDKGDDGDPDLDGESMEPVAKLN